MMRAPLVLIQWINLNCTVYTKKDIELLSRYACQLKFMKLKHDQLTEDLNNMALASEEQVVKVAQTIKYDKEQSLRMTVFDNSLN